jgi:hypothetical protein
MQTHVSHAPGSPRPKVCHSCRRAADRDAREQALAEIAELPLEERLRRIEAWIYDYKPPVPLSEMKFWNDASTSSGDGC